MSSLRRNAACLALALAGAGCPKKEPPGAPPPPPRLVEIRVVDRSPEGSAPVALDVPLVAARVADDLRAAGVLPIAVDAGARAGIDYRLKVVVEIAFGGDELRALVEARLARAGASSDEPPIVSRGAAARPLEAKTDRALALHTHVERLVDDVLANLVALTRLHTGGLPELTSGLGSADPDVLAEAIRVAAQRKERAVVPSLIELLKHDDEPTRDRALGALIEIGDRRAVKPITELSRFGDVAQMPKLIDAASALGGDEARAYLEFVASGHDDPELRALAKEGLARMARRASLDRSPSGR